MDAGRALIWIFPLGPSCAQCLLLVTRRDACRFPDLLSVATGTLSLGLGLYVRGLLWRFHWIPAQLVTAKRRRT